MHPSIQTLIETAKKEKANQIQEGTFFAEASKLLREQIITSFGIKKMSITSPPRNLSFQLQLNNPKPQYERRSTHHYCL